MPKLIVSIDGVVVKEVQLTQDRSTIGRRPYNDVVIDHLAVSGEHAVIQIIGDSAVLEDMGSTNGTYVNGKVIKRQTLAHDDTIEIGKYKIKYLDGVSGFSPSTVGASASMGMDTAAGAAGHVEAARGPRVRVLSGSASGRELELTKVVTTIGKPGFSVASITRRPHGFDLARVEGDFVPTVNGVPVDGGPVALKNHDQIELGGIRLEFLED